MTEGGTLEYDVIVVGGGNAALCAALSAREAGAKVLLMEKAPVEYRGGNCSYTGGGFRFTHGGASELRPLLSDPSSLDGQEDVGAYKPEEYRQDMLERTGGMTDRPLLDRLIAESYPTVRWMAEVGVAFELSLGTREMEKGRPNPRIGVRAVGSGAGLLNMLYTSARRAGVTVVYETKMVALLQDGQGAVCGVACRDSEGTHQVKAGGVVLACGGFEANQEMRLKYLGGAWEQAKVRGSRFNTGDGHRAALELGAKAVGQWTGCHGTPIDLDAPATGSPDSVDRLPRRSYHYGIMLNIRGRRFVDEGEDFALNNFVEMGPTILKQPRGIAFQLFDSKVTDLLEERYGSAAVMERDTLGQVAEGLGLDPAVVEGTVAEFNAAVQEGTFNPGRLDGKRTVGVTPSKSNWAMRIDTPPFRAFRVTGGITYTFGGLKIDTMARVQDTEDRPIPGLYAAGEIVGGFFYYDSLRASGLMHGAVFGRTAGAEAASRRAGG